MFDFIGDIVNVVFRYNLNHYIDTLFHHKGIWLLLQLSIPSIVEGIFKGDSGSMVREYGSMVFFALIFYIPFAPIITLCLIIVFLCIAFFTLISMIPRKIPDLGNISIKVIKRLISS